MRRLLPLLAVLLACSGEAARPPPDEASVALACACDPEEDCPACFRNVGRCCYDDERAGGQALALAARCEDDPACQVCCSECAALSCDELVRRSLCPATAPR